MPDLVFNFHNSIRRYCMERRSIWAGKYSAIQAGGRDRVGRVYTDEALATFPRYTILDAILEEIERYRPSEFACLEDAKEFYKIVVRDTNSDRGPSEGLAKNAIDEERALLENFIERQDIDELSDVRPLFYRRRLSDTEDAVIRAELKERWHVDDYWFPLNEFRPKNVEAFQDTNFESEVGSDKIATILASRGVERVWVVQETGTTYELDATEIEPYYRYGGVECFWCDDSYDWIIYVSHEGSVTVGGWLLAEVKASWPNWSARLWTSWDFE